MDQTEVFTLQELAKIKAIKQEKGIQSDAELIRFLLNEMEKNFCRKCLYQNKPGKNYEKNETGNVELAIAIGDRIAERIEARFSVMPTLTLDQAAETLGISNEKMRQLCNAGKIPFIRIDKFYRIKPADINRYLEQNYHPGKM